MQSRGGGPVLLVTALHVEYQAIRARLTGLTPGPHSAGTHFEAGRLPGGGEVAIAEFGEGNFRAAVLTERSISLFRPQALIFVGIAGALKPRLALGDVVVATKVYSYESGSYRHGEFHARPYAWEPDHELEQLARRIASGQEWAEEASVQFEPIASGSALLNSREGHLADRLDQHFDDAAAIEMEGMGVAQAGQLNGSYPVLIVRGISDRADGTKDGTDQAGWQPIAAANAAAFAVALAESLSASWSDGPEPTVHPGAFQQSAEPDYDLVQENDAADQGTVAAALGGSVHIGDAPPVSSARAAAAAKGAPAPQGPWKQTNTARDSGIVYGALGGDVVIHHTSGPAGRPPEEAR